MLPKTHFFSGIIIGFVFLLFGNFSVVEISIFLAATVLIDFDHYLYFVIRKKSFNLKKAYIYFKEKTRNLRLLSKKERQSFTTGVYVFHDIEALGIVFLFSKIISPYFLFVFLGMLLHLILDWIEKKHLQANYL
jgi:hypothetical protein